MNTTLKTELRQTGTRPNSTQTRDLVELIEAAENDNIYHPVNTDDPDFQALVESIGQRGILEPLVVTEDNCIISGHRRYAAALRAGLSRVPCRVFPIRRDDDPDHFLQLLREFNQQRVKANDEVFIEQVIDIDPDEIWDRVQEYRRSRLRVSTQALELADYKDRAQITVAKSLFLEAVQRVLHEQRDYWPLSARQVHYRLLNDPPLKHASKPGSTYKNDSESYKSLIDLLVRARLDGMISMEAISDETRPISLCHAYIDTNDFFRTEMENFLCGYWRNRQRSQPSHVELVCEKNTVKTILEPVAEEYCLPLTTGRGFTSLPPRYELVKRFRASGKDQLVLIVVSDHDPSGESICESLGQSFIRDFRLVKSELQLVKAALSFDQVRQLNLPPGGRAKPTDSRSKAFIERYGGAVYELEAVGPEVLQDLLRTAIESIFDMDLFADEVAQEREDAVFLARERARIIGLLKGDFK